MSTEPLPSTLDIRRAAARGVIVQGTLKPQDLPRFSALLAEIEGTIRAQLTFSRDEESRYLIRVQLEAEVVVTCQRCLEPLPAFLTSDSMLAAVWSDEQAAHLPRHLEPLIVDSEAGNIRDLVEDELILAMPPYSYHTTDDCKKTLAGFAAQGPAETVPRPAKPNPFNVLEQLKPGNKH